MPLRASCSGANSTRAAEAAQPHSRERSGLGGGNGNTSGGAPGRPAKGVRPWWRPRGSLTNRRQIRSCLRSVDFCGGSSMIRAGRRRTSIRRWQCSGLSPEQRKSLQMALAEARIAEAQDDLNQAEAALKRQDYAAALALSEAVSNRGISPELAMRVRVEALSKMDRKREAVREADGFIGQECRQRPLPGATRISSAGIAGHSRCD